jgi:hypothetical protein
MQFEQFLDFQGMFQGCIHFAFIPRGINWQGMQYECEEMRNGHTIVGKPERSL